MDLPGADGCGVPSIRSSSFEKLAHKLPGFKSNWTLGVIAQSAALTLEILYSSKVLPWFADNSPKNKKNRPRRTGKSFMW